MENLDEIRERINQIDDQMVRLFEERMKAAERVAEFKKERSLPIKDEAREKIVIEKGCEKIQNEEIKPYYVDFQRSVMDISCAYQSKLMNGMKVGYSGVPGAYAYIAAKRLFPEAELISFRAHSTPEKFCFPPRGSRLREVMSLGPDRQRGSAPVSVTPEPLL